MSQFESFFIWTAIVFYAFTSALYLYAFVFRKQKAFNAVSYLIVIAFIAHTAGIIARYVAVGNLPTAGPYENSVVTSWFISLFTMFIILRQSSLRALGMATMPFCMLLLGYGVMSGPQLVPMVAALKSMWLFVHVFFAWAAFSSYTVAFGISVMYLLKDRKPDEKMYEKFPPPERMDDLIFKYVIFGFITDAIAIASGALWAKDLWGNYWSWDPVETWSLVTWLIYGVAVHLRITMGWKGKRFAWIVLVALSGVIVTYFGIDWFVESSLHVFDAWQQM